uniref:Uncharacterized protein n=1 Tax=Odontella aurita TaxID=265563 RepID=A0A7S4MMS6_9STRA|mmetsp:Transcript_26444/g.78225  ORF Transcript_26444/g.78225 Transcript_26444/m.78225 type:complete len:844 (+) Transcript_26444:50-2581(+)
MPRTSRKSTGSVPSSPAAATVATGRRGSRRATVGVSASASVAEDEASSPSESDRKSNQSKREEAAAKAKRWAEERKRKKEEKKAAKAKDAADDGKEEGGVEEKTSAVVETPARTSRRRKKIAEDEVAAVAETPARTSRRTKKAAEEEDGAIAETPARPSRRRKKVTEEESDDEEMADVGRSSRKRDLATAADVKSTTRANARLQEEEDTVDEEKAVAETEEERKKKRRASALKKLHVSDSKDVPDVPVEEILKGDIASPRRRTSAILEKEKGEGERDGEINVTVKKRSTRLGTGATPKRSSRRKTGNTTVPSPKKKESSSDNEEDEDEDEEEHSSLTGKLPARKAAVAGKRSRTAKRQEVKEEEGFPPRKKAAKKKVATGEGSDGEADEVDEKTEKNITPAKRKLDLPSSSDDDKEKDIGEEEAPHSTEEKSSGRKMRKKAGMDSPSPRAEATETLATKTGEGRAAHGWRRKQVAPQLPSVLENIGNSEDKALPPAVVPSVPAVSTAAATGVSPKVDSGSPGLLGRVRKALEESVPPKVGLEERESEEGQKDEKKVAAVAPPTPILPPAMGSLPRSLRSVALDSNTSAETTPRLPSPMRSSRDRDASASPTPAGDVGGSILGKEDVKEDSAAGKQLLAKAEEPKEIQLPTPDLATSQVHLAAEEGTSDNGEASLFRPLPRSVGSFRKRLKSTIPLSDDVLELGEMSTSDIIRTGITYLSVLLAFTFCSCVFYAIIDGTSDLWGPPVGVVGGATVFASPPKAVRTLRNYPAAAAVVAHLGFGFKWLSTPSLGGNAESVFIAGLILGVWAGGMGKSSVWGEAVAIFASGTFCGALFVQVFADLLF